MWCCSRHSVQVPLSSMSEALLLEPSCVFWQLWTQSVTFYVLQLVLPNMIVIVTAFLIWLVLVSTALHAGVIHCRGMYVAVSCQTWYFCSVTYPWVCKLSHMKLLRNSAFLILKFSVWVADIFFQVCCRWHNPFGATMILFLCYNFHFTQSVFHIFALNRLV